MIGNGTFVNGDLVLQQNNQAGKSDYLRLEVIYLEGGIYLDTDFRAVRPYDSIGNLFRWPFVSWSNNFYKNLGNWAFAFEKHSKFLEFAIKLTRENCLRFQRCGVMGGAGPDFLTTAVAIYDSPDIVFIPLGYVDARTNLSTQVTYHTTDATWRAASYGKANETALPEGLDQMDCGSHKAKTCADCPKEGQESSSCNGECQWLEKEKTCAIREW